jgi:hypothetical protein
VLFCFEEVVMLLRWEVEGVVGRLSCDEGIG